MKVLIACEYSGIVRDAFAKKGHDAWSCDLLPTEIPGNHIQGDVSRVLWGKNWDLVIAHPPCTYLANSGVRWLVTKDGIDPERAKKMAEAAKFFRQFDFYGRVGGKIAIENPIMHGYARDEIFFEKGKGKPTQIIQPWQFGHGETKATCLWLYGLPKLKPTDVVEGREQRIWKMRPTPDRQKLRSKTYPGIAQAMADQWG
jgi:hypothetical protein